MTRITAKLRVAKAQLRSCGLCGHPDQRHRLWGAIRDRFVAGESLVELSRDYGMTYAEVESFLRLAIQERRKR